MLSDRSFEAVTAMFREVSGIKLGTAKRALVTGRLQRLAQDRGMTDLNAYVQTLLDGEDSHELVRLVDRLTTNETYFFREPQHFDALEAHAKQADRSRTFRVWSAASSSGEEAFSIAMVLAETVGRGPWEVVGTDLSSAMVDSARRALFPLERARHLPQDLLQRYCLKGQGEHEGYLLIARELRERVRFEGANLMRELPDIGLFDVVFLRNVLIYFDSDAKREILLRVISHLKPDGLLFTGHAESVANLDLPLKTLSSAVYAHD